MMDKKDMRFIFTVLFCICILLNVIAFSQMKEVTHPGIHTEGTFYEQNGRLYADAIVVKFKNRVIDLPQGNRYATKNDVSADFSAVKGIINRFEQEFGDISLAKQVPEATWGDTIHKHKITGELVQIHDFSQLFTFRFAKPVPLDSTIEEFSELQEVEYAHQPVSFCYFDEPNDPRYENDEQWYLAVIDAVPAWNITHGDGTIKIGIVDTGTNHTHEDLQNKVNNRDGVTGGSGVAGHGTLVAGMAGAETNNDEGIASLGWDVQLYSYGSSIYATGSESSTAADINSAASEVDIINMSFGTLKLGVTSEDLPPGCSPVPNQETLDKLFIPHSYPEIASAVSNAISQGVICIASAGNATENDEFVDDECDPMRIPFSSYPAQYTGVIAVSATKLVNEVEQFQDEWNYGSFVDVAGPGQDVLTTTYSGGYATTSGTSFSSPLVCALAGLIKSVNPGLDIDDVTDILTSTADKISASNCEGGTSYVNGHNPCLGYGRINAYEALIYTLENYGGTLRGDITLTEDLTVPAGKTLTIEPGTTVKFASGANLIVNGTLTADGSQQAITFTRGGASGNWGNIRFNSGSTGTIKNAVIEYATKAIYSLSDNVTIEDCVIEDFTEQGIYAYYSDMTIEDCIIRNPDGASHGIYLQFSNPTISETEVYDIGGIGVYDYFGNTGTFSDGRIEGCSTGLNPNLPS
jgi:hypothetical protein